MHALLVVFRASLLVFAGSIAMPSMTAAQGAPNPENEYAHLARDLVLGTWRLNRSRSSYKPGPMPLSVTRTYEEHPDGVKVTIVTVTKDGSSTSEFVAEYDSMEYPVRGHSQIDAVSLSKVNNYTAEIVLRHAGRPIGFARRVVAYDGETMTMTVSSDEVHNIAVYDKVP